MRSLAAAALALAAAVSLAVSASATRSAGAAVVVKRPPALLLTRSLSLNWAGYASFGTTFSDVQGSWTHPTATCSKGKSTYASFWLGIDGYNSSSVEQIGTEADCSKGTPVYFAWYEMYPAAPVDLDTGSYPVQAGDAISAEVNTSGTLTIADSTQSWTFTTPQSFSGFDLSSAEWIAEAPSLCAPGGGCHGAPLTNFGTVNFTGASANGQAIDHWSNDPLTMVTNSGRQVKASPSSITGGSAFSVTWSHG
jgi:hypothetical protein